MTSTDQHQAWLLLLTRRVPVDGSCKCLVQWRRIIETSGSATALWLRRRADPGQMVPAGLDPKVVAVYHGVGQLLSRFTTGKIPKAFKVLIPCLTLNC